LTIDNQFIFDNEFIQKHLFLILASLKHLEIIELTNVKAGN